MRERALLTFLAALCVAALGLYATGQRANHAAAIANRDAAEINAGAMRALLTGLRALSEARTCDEHEEGDQ